MHYLGFGYWWDQIAAVVMDAHGWEIRRYRCPTQKSTYQQFVSCTLWRLSSRLGGTFNDRC